MYQYHLLPENASLQILHFQFVHYLAHNMQSICKAYKSKELQIQFSLLEQAVQDFVFLNEKNY